MLLQDARIQTTEMSGLTKIIAGGCKKYTNVMPQYLQLLPAATRSWLDMIDDMKMI